MSVLELTAASKFVSIPWGLMYADAELVTDLIQMDTLALVQSHS